MPETVAHQKTLTALQEYMAEKGASQAAIARAVGLSSTVISQFLHSEYKGDLSSAGKKIQDFLDLEEERGDSFCSPSFVRTAQADDAFAVCSLAHKHRFMGLLLAKGGLGKTTSLREYAGHRAGACLITASAWNCNRSAVAALLTRALRVSITSCNLSDAIELVVEKLGAGALIMVDESQHLPKEVLEGLRFVHDVSGIGMVFAGTLEVSARMSNKRVGEGYDQIASRVGIRRVLSEKVERGDVEKIVCQVIPEANAEIIDFCCQKANGPGHYRSLTRYLQLATDGARARKERPLIKHFRAAQEFLMV